MAFNTREETIDGRSFIVPESDIASVNYFTSTDRENIATILNNVPLNRRNVAIQAGGNLGFFPWKFAEHFQTVVTFEPEPTNFKCLVHNVLETNVIKIQAALGDAPGWIAVENPNPGHVGLAQIKKDAVGNIPLVRIDDFAFEACDLIQLDLEGYEYHALLGAVQTIEQFKPILCLEVTGHEQRYGVGPTDLFHLLENLGYIQVDHKYLDRIYKHRDS